MIKKNIIIIKVKQILLIMILNIRKNIFFRYNNKSCWLDCFLFIFKNIIYDKFPDKDLFNLKLEIDVEYFIKDIC